MRNALTCMEQIKAMMTTALSEGKELGKSPMKKLLRPQRNVLQHSVLIGTTETFKKLLLIFKVSLLTYSQLKIALNLLQFKNLSASVN